MEKEMQELSRMLKSPDNKPVEGLMTLKTMHVPRDSTASVKYRKIANDLFERGFHTAEDHKEILFYYNKAIGKAPERSEELAMGYGNRSAFLLHIRRYEDCIIDIERAIKITYSEVMKVKLLCRKAKCLAALGKPNLQDVLDEIRKEIDQMPHYNENKKKLEVLFNETKESFKKKQKKSRQVCKPIANEEELREKEDIFQYVEVKYNKKYGRHLIATRDFEPGEIIFVEKLYISCLQAEKMFTYCYYCYTVCWTGIPCDNCSWAMFCSEECKKEAMEKYHDIECDIVPRLKFLPQLGLQLLDNIHIVLRMLIIGLKEAGSIENLRKNVGSLNVDKYEDFLKNKILDNKFTTVCNLSDEIPKKRASASSCNTLLALVNLANHSTFFGRKLDFEKLKDLTKNKDVMFIGALMLKLINIRQVNSYSFSNLPEVFDMDATKQTKAGTGCCIPIVASLLNHSCIPNVGRCFTKDKRMVIYAKMPIKKNTQLFDSYFGLIDTPKEQRKLLLEDYPFSCECYDCKFGMKDDLGLHVSSKKEYEIGSKINEYGWLQNENESGTIDNEVIKDLSETVSKATKCLPKSSMITQTLGYLLGKAFDRLYDFERNIFRPCKQK